MSSPVYINTTGRLGKDAAMQFTATGTPMLNFSVASRVGFGEREETQWLSCTLFGSRAESLQPYLTKGTLVAINGVLSRAVNQNNTFFNVNVNDVALLGGGSEASTVVEAEAEPETDAVPF